MDTAEVILGELRELRRTVEEFQHDMDTRVSKLEEKTKPLFDNGQPGEITTIKGRLTSIEHWRIKVTGIAAGVSGAVSVGMHFIFRAR